MSAGRGLNGPDDATSILPHAGHIRTAAHLTVAAQIDSADAPTAPA